jgi:hypothetical protein
MDDTQVDAAAADRRQDPYNPYARKERPDPWPIIAGRFPRIAETIRRDWGKRALDDYLQAVVDDRGSRRPGRRADRDPRIAGCTPSVPP